MGVGKTTVGKVLAVELALEFVDVDREVELRAGADIPWIFDVEGEAGFRLRESRALAEVAAKEGQLVATGGGIVLAEANRQLIKNGFCVYLKAELHQLVNRIGKDKKRPLLRNNNPRDVLRKIMEEREPLYMEVADCVVQTGSRPMRHVVREVVRLYRLHYNQQV
jgi:shikimate kinase